VFSSLTLHYVRDLNRLLSKVADSMTPGGSFVFSVEHPIYSSPTMQRFETSRNGERVWPLDNYLVVEQIDEWGQRPPPLKPTRTGEKTDRPLRTRERGPRTKWPVRRSPQGRAPSSRRARGGRDDLTKTNTNTVLPRSPQDNATKVVVPLCLLRPRQPYSPVTVEVAPLATVTA
jgi:SAM-dependent methyltransferase